MIKVSRANTLRQKIERNIGYIFKESELLVKKYPDDMVFSYIESLCHRIVLHHDPIFTMDFDNEIDMLEDFVKINYSNKALKSYYLCLIKTNEMIKKKYKNKIPNPVQSLRQSLKEMKLMREGKLPKPDIKVFLDRLDKEIKE